MDKLNYIVKTLSRTNRKDYENYIVNAIYSRVNNPNLIPVTQQYVKRDDHYALIDLYFPQINMAIEVDEPYHTSEQQKLLDEQREQEVFSVLRGLSESDIEHVKIKSVKEKREGFDYVNEQIENAVNKIKERITNISPLVWQTDLERIQTIKQKGILKNGEAFSCKMNEILGLFNKKIENCGRCFYKIKETAHRKIMFWSPILALDKNMHNNVNPKWMNYINDTHTLITEIATTDEKEKTQQNNKKKELNKETWRVTFAKYRNSLGITQRKFIGVFKIKNCSENGNIEYELISKDFDLSLLV